MTIKDALYLDIPANFGANEETSEMEYVMDQLDETVETTWGASQFVIINKNWDKVIKIPFSGGYVFCYPDNDEEDFSEEVEVFEKWSRDYCQYSLDIYNIALRKGLAPIFAEMQYLGETITGTPIYTQERIMSTFDDYSKKKYSNNSFNKVKLNQQTIRGGWTRFAPSWLAAAIDYYGEQFVSNFIKFCEDNDIIDTHSQNYGYREDGSPVIFDYASFYG